MQQALNFSNKELYCEVCQAPLGPVSDKHAHLLETGIVRCLSECQLAPVTPPSGWIRRVGNIQSRIGDHYFCFAGDMEGTYTVGTFQPVPRGHLGRPARDFHLIMAPSAPMTIVSGGQTGADIAGLVVARRLGLPTGGFAPKGYKTEKGPQVEVLKGFGLIETESAGYEERTELNLMHSDATVIYAHNPNSPGTVKTINLAKQYGKPYVVLDPRNQTAIPRTGNFIREKKISVLNIAGNRESVAQGISRQVVSVLNESLNFYISTLKNGK